MGRLPGVPHTAEEGLIRRAGGYRPRMRLAMAAGIVSAVADALGGLQRRPRGLTWGQVTQASGLARRAAADLAAAARLLGGDR